jgi:hypothetical protein
MGQTYKLTIGKVKLVYLHLDLPSAPPGSDNKKYSAVVLFKQGGNVEKRLKEALETVVNAELLDSSSKWKKKTPENAQFDRVFRDAWDVFEADWAEGYNCFTPKSERQVPILDDNIKMIDVTDNRVYDGVIAQVSVTLYTYSIDSGGKGVSSFLNSIKVLPGGKKLELGFDPAKDYTGQECLDEFTEKEEDDIIG